MYGHNIDGVHAHRDPNLRAGDADREATGARLRRHHADGRLDTEEFQERTDRCYDAKTLGDLERLVADLPPEPTSDRRHALRRLPMIPLVPILIAIVAISAVSGHHGHFGIWLLIPMFLLFRFWLRGNGPRGMRLRASNASAFQRNTRS